MNVTMVATATLVWGGLMWLEWRRTDRTHRGARLAATTLAVMALAWLGGAWENAQKNEASRGAVLWTEQAAGVVDVTTDKLVLFALPGANAAPPDAVVVPDVAYLRRTWPEINRLEIRGDGVDAEDTAVLAGVRVEFAVRGGRRGFFAVDAPKLITRGEALRVRGRVGGFGVGKSAVVTLENPDGTVLTTTGTAGPGGEVDFEIVAPAAPAAGRFLWTLRAAASEAPERAVAQETLGVAVVAPEWPRVLMLESAPRMDTARLRAWFAENGARLVSRTLISRERYRFAGSGGGVAEFGAVDDALLAGYDVVLTDGATLAALNAAERRSLRVAVREKGVGVGLLADDALLTAAQGGVTPSAETDDFFLPWRVAAVGVGDAAADGRRARLQGPPGSALPVEPVAVAGFEMKPVEGQVTWLRDSQTRTLAGAVRRGRGWVALTLVSDTWRWRQAERPAAFAEYWSWWLQALAPSSRKARWTITTAQPRVDARVRLLWTGGSGVAPSRAVIKGESETTETALALAQDRHEPERWTGDFWPRRAGWHRVVAEDGATVDFWVSSPEAWTGVRAQDKSDATARLAAQTAGGTAGANGSGAADAETRATPWWMLAVFVGSAGYLWLEGRAHRTPQRRET